MRPDQLKAESFASYPPQAQSVAAGNIELLQQLPLAFLPLLLRELIVYDWKFPQERIEMDRQLSYLRAFPPAELHQLMSPFSKLQLKPEIESLDWVNAPAQFSEDLTAHLWATRQIDAFRAAAVTYVNGLSKSAKSEPLPAPRLTIAVIGQGVTENKYPLFRKLRPHGVYYRRVKPDAGLHTILETLSARASAHPVPFGHWYLDGGSPEDVSASAVTRISYQSASPVRAGLLDVIEKSMTSGGSPELLRTRLAQMRPEDVGLTGEGDAAVMNRFQISVLTEGSGTQIYATTFVQWAAREALRRAQPLTLLARFAPRQASQSMKEILVSRKQKPVLDPQGSLVDGDMGAYYTWLNQQRLPEADRAGFLVWFEGHDEALAIGPKLKAGTESSAPVGLPEILGSLG
jgi:hypothetical protein